MGPDRLRLAPEAIGFDTKNHVEDDKGYDEAYTNEACGPNQCGSGNHSVLDTEDESISATSARSGFRELTREPIRVSQDKAPPTYT